MTSTPLRRGLSLCAGWLADRRIPRAWRAPLFRAYARRYRVDLADVRLPLAEHPSLAAFFVRRLREGARSFPSDPRTLPSPCDGTLQASDRIGGELGGELLVQAKGRPYSVRELLGGVGGDVALDGGHAWTIYLSPRDYHRVHTPVDGELAEIAWTPGARYSVAPGVLAARAKVLSINERCAMRLDTPRGPVLLVMVGALNVGRIRVVGVERDRVGPLPTPRRLARGDELARFELGSTVVLLTPPGYAKPAPIALGARVRMGDALGSA